MTKQTPRIYVACLAAYNSGKYHGAWIDATQDIEDIQRLINSILRTSPVRDAEEYAIHDYEFFGSYKVSEYEGIEQVHKIAVFLEENPKLHSAVLDNFHGDIEQAQEALEDNYQGLFTSLEDYALYIAEETGLLSSLPEQLQYYFDFESYGRDMELNGDIYTIETDFEELHVFWNA